MSINLSILLAAIAAVESGNNPLAVGSHGEKSAYQISAAVWSQHAGEHGVEAGDFAANASNPAIAERVATAHAVWLARQLESDKIPVTVENLALAWHLGVAGAKRAMGPGYINAKDYAHRVSALYADALAHQPSNIPAHLSSVLPPPRKPDAP